ncbi:YbaB/EbfC family nucleoid-associated protein [Saccharothrix sp. NRRL B-16348]|uniref:YbaB/EbfC family nucleoid-associated protein n=1 Tax=Saccharothrix sp. NRRL B-16348 TaxID=1415542 RepID=UPI0006B05FFA|nr:YbaB/EbfC family nucleoid-associated protein [Saccharothrix sp. NRRL B-16348]
MDETQRAAQRVADTERQVAEHVARTGPVRGRASSPDGAVTVVTAPGGPPQEVRVSPSALNMGPRALADEILRVSARASRDAASRMHRAVERVADPAAVRALTEIGFERGPDDDGFDGTYLRGSR